MNLIFIYILFLLTPFFAKGFDSVGVINSERFSGLWYEIARTYNYFEEDCVAPTVEYRVLKKNTLQVTNRCFKKNIDGDLIKYKGVVQVLNEGEISKLKKTYFWFFSKSYNVIYLDNYEMAILADDNFQYVWIMNRKPFMEANKLSELIIILSAYMDTKELIYPKQYLNGKYR